MPVAKFLGYTTAGSLIWNTLFVWLGFQLGDRYHLVEQYMDPISKVVYVLIVLAVAGAAFAVGRFSAFGTSPSVPGNSSPEAGFARSLGWTERRSIARNTRASSRAWSPS